MKEFWGQGVLGTQYLIIKNIPKDKYCVPELFAAMKKADKEFWGETQNSTSA